jgi:hypothetical protein
MVTQVKTLEITSRIEKESLHPRFLHTFTTISWMYIGFTNWIQIHKFRYRSILGFAYPARLQQFQLRFSEQQVLEHMPYR